MKTRKLVSLMAVAALLATMLSVISFSTTAAAEYAYDFEGSTDVPGWTNFGGGLNMSIDTSVAHSGSNSLKANGQSNTWTSATKDILPIVKANGAGTYTYTAWLRADVNIDSVCFRLRINGVSTEAQVPSFANEGLDNVALCPIRQGVVKDTWTEFSFSFEVTEDDLTKGTSWEPCYCDIPTGATYWIDDVSLVKGGAGSTEKPGYAYDFEGSTQNPGWTNFGGGLNMSIDTTVAHTGSNSLKANGQSNTWTSATKDILPIVKANGAGEYTFTTWLRADVNIDSVCFRLRINGVSSEAEIPSFANEGLDNVALCPLRQSVAKDTWTEFTFTFTVTEDDLTKGTSWEPCFCDIPVGATYWIDDVSLTKAGAEGGNEGGDSAVDGDNDQGGYTFGFEGDSAPADLGWTNFGGDLNMSIDSAVAHSGSQSLKAEGHNNTWTSATKDILPYVKANGAGTYSFSIWLYSNARIAEVCFRLRINGISENDPVEMMPSFANEGPQNTALCPIRQPVNKNTWTEFTFSFEVKEEDLNKGTSWEPCFCDIPTGATYWIDDVKFVKGVITPGESGGESGENNEFAYDFEGSTENPGWTNFGGVLDMSIDTTVAHGGSNSLKASGSTNTWTSPTKDILPFVKANGAATYTLEGWILVDQDVPHASWRLRINGVDSAAENPSFANELYVDGIGGNCCYFVNKEIAKDTWTKFFLTFAVSEEDLSKGDSWEPCFDSIPVGAAYWIDDVTLVKHGAGYEADENGNYVPAVDSSFEGITSPYDTYWGTFGGGQSMEIDSTVAHSGQNSLKAYGHSNEWTSPSYNLYSIFKDLGPGMYTVTAWARADQESPSITLRMRCLDVRSEDANPSFVNEPYVEGGNANVALALGTYDLPAGEWVEFTNYFIVTDEDIQGEHIWELNFTSFQPGTTFWIDDVMVKKFVAPDLYFTYETSIEMTTEENVLNGRKVMINAITAETIEDDELVWEVLKGEATIESVEELEEIPNSQSVYIKPVRGSVVVVRATLKSNPELYAEIKLNVKANVAPLRSLISKAEGVLEGDYAAADEKALEEQIAKAQELLGADEITQDQVDEMLDALQAAMDKCEGKAPAEDEKPGDDQKPSDDNKPSDDEKPEGESPVTGVESTALVLALVLAVLSFCGVVFARRRAR